jgi:amidase
VDPTPDPHPDTEDLAFRDVSALRADLTAGRLDSAELVEALLARIEALDDPSGPWALRSVLAVASSARQEAAACDADRRDQRVRGPLHGIPVLVKDNIEVAGLPGTAGSTALLGRPPTADAPLAARLRGAGAVVLGATNLSEWANIRSPRSTGGWSAVGGLTVNPWALDRNAGGSSSGAGAALAAGLAPLAVGTETDGSITCPASLNGVSGLKPTVGAVPTAGMVPVCASQDSPGPMARRVADVASLYEVLSGVAGVGDRAAAGIAGLRVAVATTWRTGHPATDEAFEAALPHLERAGAVVHRVDVATPGRLDVLDEGVVMLCELYDDLSTYLAGRAGEGPRSLAEVVAFESAHADTELAHFGHEHFEKALDLRGRGGAHYGPARARNLAWALDTCLRPALAGADVLVAPTYGPAWKNDLVLGGHAAAASPVTMAPAIAGWPLATVPMAVVDGLPVGLGVVGRPGDEGVLLAVATVVEAGVTDDRRSTFRPTWRTPGRA